MNKNFKNYFLYTCFMLWFFIINLSVLQSLVLKKIEIPNLWPGDMSKSGFTLRIWIKRTFQMYRI
jgi:hypothetical protein